MEEDTDTVERAFLQLNVPTAPYTYITSHILLVPKQNKLMKVDLHTLAGRLYTLRAEKNGKIHKN